MNVSSCGGSGTVDKGGATACDSSFYIEALSSPFKEKKHNPLKETQPVIDKTEGIALAAPLHKDTQPLERNPALKQAAGFYRDTLIEVKK